MSMTANADNATEEKTTVGGKAFLDLTNIKQDSDGVDTAATGTGIDVKRFYLSVSHSFDDTWSANVTSDFNYVSNDSETQIYIKKAYLQFKASDAFVARLGSADLPWVPFVEDLYGYRYVENVLVDRLKFGTSADWGVHAGGKFSDGMVSYAVSVINGNGYKNPTRSKSVDFEGRLAVSPVKGLTLAAGFYSGKLGKDIEGGAPTEHTANRFTALAAYVTPKFRIGGEYFTADDWTQVTAVPSDKADGYSVWGSINFTDKVAGFARYDGAKPHKDLTPDLKDQYYNVGVAYKPRKNVDIAFVYKHDKVENGTISTGNGTIGGVTDGKYDEVGLWAQVAF
ncbi:MAG: porin [Steroidobacterales bacterium]